MQINKKIMYLLAGVFVVAGCWYLFAGRNDVSDIGQRADETRGRLDSAREEQREQAETLDRAADATDRSKSAVRDSQETADRIEELERSDAEIIRDCQSIIANVRARGKTESQSQD